MFGSFVPGGLGGGRTIAPVSSGSSQSVSPTLAPSVSSSNAQSISGSGSSTSNTKSNLGLFFF